MLRIEEYIKERDNGLDLQEIQEYFCLSEGSVYSLELAYTCYLRNLSLDKAIEIIEFYCLLRNQTLLYKDTKEGIKRSLKAISELME